MSKKLLISEIFGPTIQGEGALIGQPCLFVRAGGCDFRCDWCDTLYAVEPKYKADWQAMSAENILQTLQQLAKKPMLVTLSGGNPALQDFSELIRLGGQQGFTFALETQGSVACDWFAELDYLVLSPKPPSSKMKNDEKKLAACLAAAMDKAHCSLKLVVADKEDYLFARELADKYPQLPVYLQVCNPEFPKSNANKETTDLLGLAERQRWLSEMVCEDGWNNAIVLPQMHVWLWGNTAGH